LCCHKQRHRHLNGNERQDEPEQSDVVLVMETRHNAATEIFCSGIR
jgi:hypothetical protein